jgi:hypothetical protein
MIGNCLEMLINGAKTLLGKKSTQEILKYLSTITIAHVGNKFKVNQSKYDPIDMKNMVYHYNMNNNCEINKNNVDQMIDIMTINRFINELNNNNQYQTDDIISNVIRTLNDRAIAGIYEEMMGNNIVQQFDTDTIETTSIADNYEISSGGIYLPDDNVYTSTIEGCNLANAKNEYLRKRIELGETASNDSVRSILNEYYESIDFEKVINYFNN